MGSLGSKEFVYDTLTKIIQLYPTCIHSHDRIKASVSMGFCFICKHMNASPRTSINHYSEMKTKYVFPIAHMFKTMDKVIDLYHVRHFSLTYHTSRKMGHESRNFTI